MKNFEYTVNTGKSVDEAVSAVEKNTAAKGFRVLCTHDLSGMLAEKGFAREPLKIVEICNAKYANEVLEKDVTAVLMLPCPIVVFEKAGQTHMTTMLPSVMAEFYPGKGIEPVAGLVEKAVLAIVDESAK
jgi:uncharacterized protein (DUF302 family)